MNQDLHFLNFLEMSLSSFRVCLIKYLLMLYAFFGLVSIQTLSLLLKTSLTTVAAVSTFDCICLATKL